MLLKSFLAIAERIAFSAFNTINDKLFWGIEITFDCMHHLPPPFAHTWVRYSICQPSHFAIFYTLSSMAQNVEFSVKMIFNYLRSLNLGKSTASKNDIKCQKLPTDPLKIQFEGGQF